MRARDNAERAAKEKIEKLNLLALKKVKYEKLAEKNLKNFGEERQFVIDAHKEKIKAAQTRKLHSYRSALRDADEYQQALSKELTERKVKQRHMEDEVSASNFKQAVSRMGHSRAARMAATSFHGGDGADAKS